MALLQQVLKLELVAFLLTFAAVLFYQMLTGRINLAGLLLDTQTGALSWDRVQLVALAGIGVVEYLTLSEMAHGALPELPMSLLVLTGGATLSIWRGSGDACWRRLNGKLWGHAAPTDVRRGKGEIV